MENNQALVLSWLLGSAMDELDEQIMFVFWITSGSAICHTYREVIAVDKRSGR